MGRAAAARALAATGGGTLVYSYCATRGAYAGVSIEGTVLSTRDAVNQVGSQRWGAASLLHCVVLPSGGGGTCMHWAVPRASWVLPEARPHAA